MLLTQYFQGQNTPCSTSVGPVSAQLKSCLEAEAHFNGIRPGWHVVVGLELYSHRLCSWETSSNSHPALASILHPEFRLLLVLGWVARCQSSSWEGGAGMKLQMSQWGLLTHLLRRFCSVFKCWANYKKMSSQMSNYFQWKLRALDWVISRRELQIEMTSRMVSSASHFCAGLPSTKKASGSAPQTTSSWNMASSPSVRDLRDLGHLWRLERGLRFLWMAWHTIRALVRLVQGLVAACDYIYHFCTFIYDL